MWLWFHLYPFICAVNSPQKLAAFSGFGPELWAEGASEQDSHRVPNRRGRCSKRLFPHAGGWLPSPHRHSDGCDHDPYSFYFQPPPSIICHRITSRCSSLTQVRDVCSPRFLLGEWAQSVTPSTFQTKTFHHVILFKCNPFKCKPQPVSWSAQ